MDDNKNLSNKLNNFFNNKNVPKKVLSEEDEFIDLDDFEKALDEGKILNKTEITGENKFQKELEEKRRAEAYSTVSDIPHKELIEKDGKTIFAEVALPIVSFKDSSFSPSRDFRDLPENLYRQVIKIADYITVKENLNKNNHIVVTYDSRLCNTDFRMDLMLGVGKVSDKLSTNYFKINHNFNCFCDSFFPNKDKTKTLVKDKWGCLWCSKYNPCLIGYAVYYKYLSLTNKKELTRQRNLYKKNKDVCDGKILHPKVADDIKYDIKDFPLITLKRIKEIRKDIDNHKYFIFNHKDNIVFRYSIPNENGSFEIVEDILPKDTINSYISYQKNRKERFVFETLEKEDAFQYLFILKLLSQDVSLYQKYLKHIKSFEKKSLDILKDTLNTSINLDKESSELGFYGCVCGDDREEVFNQIQKISFGIQSKFGLNNSYVKLSALEFMQIHAEIKGAISKFSPLIYNEIEKNKIFVITGLNEFTKAYSIVSKNYEIERRQLEYCMKILNSFNSREFIILAGTKIEVDNFINLSDSLKFKFNDNKFVLDNMTIDEIYTCFKSNLPKDFKITKKEEKEFKDYLTFNLGVFPLKNKSLALYLANYMVSLNKFELPVNVSGIKQKNFMNELDTLIGMNDIKTEVKKLYNYVKYREALKEQEIDIPSANLHMLFTGNPGTGKTTVARIIASALFNIGVIKENKLIEVERKDLVAEYVGQTAVKTSQVIDKALGGVLFIDEAYSLSPECNQKDFGVEAIATIIKAMEDKKDDLIIIFAGYKNEMKRFVDSNPGIASRLGYTFHFEDYSEDELLEMFLNKMKTSNFIVKDECINPLKKLFQYFHNAKNLGNGRFVDKLFQIIIQNRANITEGELNVITKKSIPSIEDIIKNLPDNEKMIKPENISLEEKKRVSYHESGHLIVGLMLGRNNIERITVEVSANGALGYVKYKNEETSGLKVKKDYEDEICILLGGLVSEEVNLGSYSNGGGSDLPKVVNIAKHMVCKCGMSSLKFGALCLKEDDEKVVNEVNSIIDSQYQRARIIIEENKDKIEKISSKLAEVGTVNEEDINNLVN